MCFSSENFIFKKVVVNCMDMEMSSKWIENFNLKCGPAGVVSVFLLRNQRKKLLSVLTVIRFSEPGKCDKVMTLAFASYEGTCYSKYLHRLLYR